LRCFTLPDIVEVGNFPDHTDTKDISMIDFYALTSPNVQKIYIMLEETKLPYKEHFVDVWQGDQFNTDFLKINPNAKIPAIAGSDPNWSDCVISPRCRAAASVLS
jgi:hypothetical protein